MDFNEIHNQVSLLLYIPKLSVTYMQLIGIRNMYTSKPLTSHQVESLRRASLPCAIQISRGLEEVCHSGRESLGDQLVNGLSRVVVVVPHSRRPVRIRSCDIAVKTE